MILVDNYNKLKEELGDNVTLVAVSKSKPKEDILELYQMGHRDFGENYVQELVKKQVSLPKDIRWHFIGHLQSNKVKYIAPFIHLIQAVDSIKLLNIINKLGQNLNKKISCLIQISIAEENTKFGMSPTVFKDLLTINEQEKFNNVTIKGLMGIASNTAEQERIRNEYKRLHDYYLQAKECLPDCKHLSMGMSSDYRIALQESATAVRIGSLIFGERA